MKENKKEPDIRFKGFTDAWEQRKLEDVVDFLDTMRKPLEGAKRISGPYPYYGASGIVDYVDGYLFDEELVLLSEDGANITDRNYPVCFLASGKYWVNNHAHVLRTKDGNENNFICNSLERKDYKQYNSGMAMPKLNQEVCRGIPISCPSFDEQKKIGDYFRNLDNLITLHQRNCDETKELKKFMLQKMFPKKGEKKPEIRFEGFTDDWEQRKWIDTVDISTEMVNPSSGEYDDMPHIAPGNIESFTGRILDNVKTVKEEQLISGKFRFRPGDVVYGKINPQLGKYFYASVHGLTSADAYVFNSKNGLTQKFLFALLQTNDFFKYSVSVSKRSGMPKINRDELNAYGFWMPTEAEQVKIGEFILHLDNLITFHQRKCDEIKVIKKFMLQNMFPQKG